MTTQSHTLHFPDGAMIDTAAAERLLGLGDQFIENWIADQADVPAAEKDPDLAERKAEWEAIRPVLASAPALLSTCVAIGRAGDVRDEQRRAQLHEAISEAGGWALLDPRMGPPSVPAVFDQGAGLSPAEIGAILGNCNLRIAVTLENPLALAPPNLLPDQAQDGGGRVSPGNPSADPLTVAYVAMGASKAIRGCEFGVLPAEVSDHFSGELGFIQAVTDEAWRLDAVAYALEERGGLDGVFCYEVAEPFGEHFAKALIAEHMQEAPGASADAVATRMFEDFSLPTGAAAHDYAELLQQGTQHMRARMAAPGGVSGGVHATAASVERDMVIAEQIERLNDALPPGKGDYDDGYRDAAQSLVLAFAKSGVSIPKIRDAVTTVLDAFANNAPDPGSSRGMQ